MWSIFCHTLRFFQLLLIFSPVVILFPLKYFEATKKLWLKVFVKSVEMAGVVWIKAFQYMSHRRDIIGADMADQFVHLRENAPQHSFQDTKKNFEKLYGKKIE
jgi:predicted unusual protein kinase regulating ubiquinone biosynthesis (AarF/ABC1/UbiB family)